MAFEKRTWLARIGTGLNKFIIGNKDSEGKQTLTNAPDLPLTQEGDVISAENLNDLEDRIEAGLNEKQNTLTFDDVPTSGSNNPVKSGGVYTGLAGKQNTLTFDNAPTLGSTNPVTSGGVYTAIANLKLTKIWSADLYPPEPIDYPLTISLPSGSDRLLIEYVPNGGRNVSKYILVSRQNLTDSFEISETSLSGTNQLTVYTRKVTGLSSGLRFELANHYMGSDETAKNSILPYAIYKVGDIYNS